MCSLAIGQMFDIYLSSLLYHIYSGRVTPSDGVRSVSTPPSEIEQIVRASVWRVIIFARLQITMVLCM